MAEEIISIKSLTKIYRAGLRQKVTAVNDLTISVRRGTIVGFLGSNGAGKTTTMYTILDLIRPTSGSVLLFGQPTSAPESRNKVGFASELVYTYSYRSPRQVLQYYGALSGLRDRAVADAIQSQLEQFSLTEAADRPIKTFSKGMLQRVGLAQAMLHQPELLILDEPTSGLDPVGRKLLFDLVLEQKKKGGTVFLSSHILSDIERVCDDVIMIKKGKMVFSGPNPGQNLEQLYLERVGAE